jgi:hypothetical protein
MHLYGVRTHAHTTFELFPRLRIGAVCAPVAGAGSGMTALKQRQPHCISKTREHTNDCLLGCYSEGYVSYRESAVGSERPFPGRSAQHRGQVKSCAPGLLQRKDKIKGYCGCGSEKWSKNCRLELRFGLWVFPDRLDILS